MSDLRHRLTTNRVGGLFPHWLVLQQLAPQSILLISPEGTLIGMAGLFLILLKHDTLSVAGSTIFTAVPWLLVVITAAFAVGLWAPVSCQDYLTEKP